MPNKKNMSNHVSPRINNAYVSKVNEIKSFRLPVYRQTKDCDFVEYYAFNPDTGKMGRKRIKVNLIKGKVARRKYANELILRLIDKLASGWNPYIEERNTYDLKPIAECFDEWEAYNLRMLDVGTYRTATVKRYNGFVAMLRKYVAEQGHVITYLYQFDSKYITNFLDYNFIEKKNSATTWNCYLGSIKVFCRFLLQRGYITADPTEAIKTMSRQNIKKVRKTIPRDVLASISNYFKEKNPPMLLVSYLIYYCLIRPKEICRLKVSNINLDAHTITIHSEQAKNRREMTVTMNDKVVSYIRELGLMDFPSDYYIFSKFLRPGAKEISPVRLSQNWEYMRNALGLPKCYQLYSLKDTGITDLADSNVANITIRDQARHSSLAITDVYTRHGGGKAVEELEKFEGYL